MRRLSLVAAATLLAALASAGPANAVITGSSITSPAPDAVYPIQDPSSSTPQTFPLGGTTTGAGAAKLRCYRTLPDGSADIGGGAGGLGSFAATGGAFSLSADLNALHYGFPQGCRLRAVPSDDDTGDLSRFAGPLLLRQYDTRETVGAGPDAGGLSSFSLTFNQRRSLAYGYSIGWGMGLQYADDEQEAEASWWSAAQLAGFRPDPTRTAAMIDGHEAFFAGDLLATSGFDAYPARPTITDLHVTHTTAGTPGEMTESETPVRCPGDPAPTIVNGSPVLTPAACSSFSPVGVRFDRSMRPLDSTGRSWMVTDVVHSTDGRAHQLDLLYSNVPGNLDAPAIRVPWAADPTQNAWSGGSLGAPPTLPASLFTEFDTERPPGPQNPIGALTVGPGFVEAVKGADDMTISTRYVRTVPAGGAVTIQHAVSTSVSQADAHALAARAERSMTPPSIAPATPDDTVTVPAPDTPSAPPPPSIDRTKPVLSKLTRTRTGFRVTLSEAAKVTVTIARRDPGRRSGKQCRTPTAKLRKARRCTRLTRIGAITAMGRGGVNAVAFENRVGRRTLKPASYQASFVARDAAGNTSTTRTVTFTVAKAKKKAGG